MKVLDIYKEGFSAVGFNCDKENFKTGVINLSDAISFILDITLQGKQVNFHAVGMVLKGARLVHSQREFDSNLRQSFSFPERVRLKHDSFFPKAN